MQSHGPGAPPWVRRCVATVREWSRAAGHDHEVLGDELLDLAPGWVTERSTSVLPVTDVARLVLLIDRLERGWERVVWCDADVVVFAPRVVDLPVAPLAVGWEVWVTGDGPGRLRAVALPNNSVLVATDPDHVRQLLAFTLETARTTRRPIHPRRLGPDVLVRWTRRRVLPPVASVTLVSPRVVADLAAGDGPALRRWVAELGDRAGRVGALNLCSSMAPALPGADRTAGAAVERLLRWGTPPSGWFPAGSDGPTR